MDKKRGITFGKVAKIIEKRENAIEGLKRSIGQY